jgi:uncharacterized protein YceK
MMRFVILIAAVLLSGCTSVIVSSNGEASYRYSTFNFSGDSWAVQKRRCEVQDLKPRHLGTDCGFWTCVSRYDCTQAE